jgi:hypothetical protein
MLAATEKMTIYAGFRGGKPMPLEQAGEKLETITAGSAEIEMALSNLSSQASDSELAGLVSVCEMYLNRLRQNAETMKSIVGKFQAFQEGGKKYGFFQLRRDTKEWDRDTKKLLNVRSNVELFLKSKWGQSKLIG